MLIGDAIYYKMHKDGGWETQWAMESNIPANAVAQPASRDLVVWRCSNGPARTEIRMGCAVRERYEREEAALEAVKRQTMRMHPSHSMSKSPSS
jgi:hypothetical protein